MDQVFTMLPVPIADDYGFEMTDGLEATKSNDAFSSFDSIVNFDFEDLYINWNEQTFSFRLNACIRATLYSVHEFAFQIFAFSALQLAVIVLFSRFHIFNLHYHTRL